VDFEADLDTEAANALQKKGKGEARQEVKDSVCLAC